MIYLDPPDNIDSHQSGLDRRCCWMAVANCMSTLHHGWCWKRHPPWEYINPKISFLGGWGGAEILSQYQRLQKCERFLPCIEKLSQRSVTPVFHQLRLMDCFEIWVKLFSITSQNSDTTSVLSLNFGNCFKVLHKLFVEKVQHLTLSKIHSIICSRNF